MLVTVLRGELAEQGCSAEVIAYADKANERLRRRFYRMTLNKGINRNIATTAIAR